MASPLHVRRWNGITIPTAGRYKIDAQHTTVGFVARHLMVTQVRGRFDDVEAEIVVADDPLQSSAQATIKTASIITGTEDRDVHLKSPDFLDVEKFPDIEFSSRAIRPAASGSKWTVVNGAMRRRRRDAHGVSVLGDLTIRETTRPIELDVAVDGVTHDPWGGERLAITATGEIDREEYDMTWNVALEAGGWLVSQKIQIEIRAQGIRQE